MQITFQASRTARASRTASNFALPSASTGTTSSAQTSSAQSASTFTLPDADRSLDPRGFRRDRTHPAKRWKFWRCVLTLSPISTVKHARKSGKSCCALFLYEFDVNPQFRIYVYRVSPNSLELQLKQPPIEAGSCNVGEKSFRFEFTLFFFSAFACQSIEIKRIQYVSPVNSLYKLYLRID